MKSILFITRHQLHRITSSALITEYLMKPTGIINIMLFINNHIYIYIYTLFTMVKYLYSNYVERVPVSPGNQQAIYLSKLSNEQTFVIEFWEKLRFPRNLYNRREVQFCGRRFLFWPIEFLLHVFLWGGKELHLE